ncbi:dermonecrotic toxin domain-containing protein [Martelella alba]|uniref:Dermonecrotic toxin N-terminal domain-containing protein n=1 Tax=Martelella alba TaxID=2590451 RepID=A0ABY2SM87_9HYPH|nr:DUF6543 domain-containing protein [Martelella alba]TKI06889.1 hypothetical protein FCN80_07995 [Martelella alba]
MGHLLSNALPFLLRIILPYSAKLQTLADYVKNLVENQLGTDILSLIPAYRDRNGNGFVWLGILALVYQFYSADRRLPAPSRKTLRIPLMLARLFTRAARFWRMVCGATEYAGPRSVDKFGRLRLSGDEKQRQYGERLLARGWARNNGGQIGAEHAALRYYGIRTATGGHPPSTNRVSCDGMPLAGPSNLPGPVSAASAIYRVIRQIGRALVTALPRLTGVGAAPASVIGDRHSGYRTLIIRGDFPMPHPADLLRKLERLRYRDFPRLQTLVARQLSEDIARRFAVAVDADEIYLRGAAGARPTDDISLTQFALRRFLTNAVPALADKDSRDALIFAENRAAQPRRGAALSLTPAELDHLMGQWDMAAAYRDALNRYWLHHHERHALGNLLRILAQLVETAHRLGAVNTDMALCALGFGNRHTFAVSLRLFEAAGIVANDLFVMTAPDLRQVILYLPRAQRPFRLFANHRAMANWITEQCRHPLPSEEILMHFAVKDRWLDATGALNPALTRALAAAADDPDSLGGTGAAFGEPLYLLLTRQQRQRALEDADFLHAFPRAAKTQAETDAISFTRVMTLYAPLPEMDTESALRHIGATGDAFLEPPQKLGPAAAALFIAAADAAAFLTANRQSDAPLAHSHPLDLAAFARILNQDWATFLATPISTAAERRVIRRLTLKPQGYEREIRIRPNGAIDSHTTVYLPDARAQPPMGVPAISLSGAWMPLRFNDRLNAFEIYDITDQTRPGYPVIKDEQSCWVFGRHTYSGIGEGEQTSVADYRFVSIRLYEKLMENINNYCGHGADFSPVNSHGMAQDAAGRDYLVVKRHYIQLTPVANKRHFIVAGRNNATLTLRFDHKKKSFILVPTQGNWRATHKMNRALPAEDLAKATDAARSFRQGFRSTDEKTCRLSLAAEKALTPMGLGRVIHYGLSGPEIARHPEHAPLAHTIRDLFARCDDVLRQVEEYLGDVRLERYFQNALRLQRASQSLQLRAYRLFSTHIAKTRALLKSHLNDGLARIWTAVFSPDDLHMLSLKHDPLQRIWFNTRALAAGPANRYLDRHCQYECREISANRHYASVGVAPKGPGPSGAAVPPLFARETVFTHFVERLWRNNMTQNEINALISLPEAASMEISAFMTPAELAGMVFRTKAMARARLLLVDADYFAHLLWHLHAILYRHCEHRFNHPHIRSVLFMLAFQGLEQPGR